MLIATSGKNRKQQLKPMVVQSESLQVEEIWIKPSGAKSDALNITEITIQYNVC